MRNPDIQIDKEARGESAMKMEKKPLGRKHLIMAIMAVMLLVGGYFGYESYKYVTTDNASVQARTTLLSSKVSGLIVQVNVQENEKVKAGQLLVELKSDDYEAQLEQIESEHAALVEQLKGAETTYHRTLDLLGKGAATQERLDLDRTQYHALQKRAQSAKAQATLAKTNLAYTKILAPNDGTVGRKSFEVGMLANPGQPLFGFVEGSERWIIANLKETDMDLITLGIKAWVTIDAISKKDFEGVIESISPTTGATFSLLPPDNATGNFTKVVQRVPVRIKLLNLTGADIDRLQSGLSAEVKIQVH